MLCLILLGNSKTRNYILVTIGVIFTILYQLCIKIGNTVTNSPVFVFLKENSCIQSEGNNEVVRRRGKLIRNNTLGLS